MKPELASTVLHSVSDDFGDMPTDAKYISNLIDLFTRAKKEDTDSEPIGAKGSSILLHPH